MVDDGEVIKYYVVDFYRNLYSDPGSRRPSLDGTVLSSLEKWASERLTS